MNSNHKKAKLFSFKHELFVSKFIMLIVFGILVLLPIIRMLLNITEKGVNKVFSSPVIGTVIFNSVLVSLTATAVSVIIAYLLALCMERTAIRGKVILSALLVLPMLIPSISHGMGLVILFGNNGLITNFLGLSSNVYGFWGIVLGYVMYTFPVAFIMLSDVMRYEDKSPYEAALVLNISKPRQFFSISLPFLKRPLITTLFTIFTMSVTDYGVPLMIGGKYKTLSVVMYQEVIGQLDFDSGSVYGVFLLIPAIIAFLVDLFNRSKGNTSYVTNPPSPSRSKITLAMSYIYTAAVTLFIMLPLVSFIVLGFTKNYPTDYSFSFKNVVDVFKNKGSDYLLNSIIVAFATAAIGTVIGFVTAYITARSKSFFAKILHLVAITAMAVPGIILGLSYVIMYKGSAVYGTLFILIMANTVHFIASPYLMMYNSLGKLNSNLESVGETLGISRMRIIRNVIIPQNISTLTEMFSYFFVNCMMTISAVSFLARTTTKPISLMINQFEAQLQLENAAVVSLAILMVNLLIKCIASFAKRRSLK